MYGRILLPGILAAEVDIILERALVVGRGGRRRRRRSPREPRGFLQ
jgi:hypothetical protein